MAFDAHEFAIDHYGYEKYDTATCSTLKSCAHFRRLAEQYPDEVHITSTNLDGSFVCTYPSKWFHLPKPRTRKLTEEQKQAMSERARAMGLARRKNKDNNLDENDEEDTDDESEDGEV